MEYEPNPIISRIQWCRFQQQLPTVTQEERAGWRAEEAGLLDALAHRERVAFMRIEYPSLFTRYQCGLEDGQALLRLSSGFPTRVTRLEGMGSDRSTTPAWVDRRRSKAPPLAPVESRR